MVARGDRARVWVAILHVASMGEDRKRRLWESQGRVALLDTSAGGSDPREGEGRGVPAVLVAQESAAIYGEDLSLVLRSEIEKLPERMRAVVEGWWMEDRSVAALAREEGIPVRTVGYRLNRAYDLLRPRLARVMRGLEG